MRRCPRSFVLAGSLAALVAPAANLVVAAVDADLDAARAGLAAFLRENRPATPSTYNDLPGCPAIGLDRLQGALDATGLTGELDDWGAEIEWGDYEEIDPDLMGIVCSGDADGNANDTDFGLYASVRVVDAGTEDQAQEVLQARGYGALEGEVGDVPGGELFSTCLDEDGLGSLCLSFWSFDGFVVGATVVSSEQDVPSGTSTAVLEAVLPEVLATLAAYEPTSVTTPVPSPGESLATEPQEATTEGGPGVAAARAGLADRLADMDQIDELAPLEDCPVAERDSVVGALETAGVDTPIESLLAEQGPSLTNGTTWQAVGLVCTGIYVGAEDDPSFPELRISVVVADFDDTDGFLDYLADVHPELDVGDDFPIPALGSGTVGQCAHVDRTEQCDEYWEQDGFVVGVQIADRVFVDRPTASAVVGALVPTVVEALAAEPEVAEAADVTVPSDVLETARARLGGVPAAEDAAECQFIDQPAVDDALAEADIDVATGDWSAVTSEGAEGAVAGVACSGAAGQGEVRIEVLDFVTSDAAADVIDLVHGCEKVGDTEFCVETWEQDGLTVTVSVTAVGVDVSQPQVRALVDALAPVVIAQLAT